MKTGSTLTTVMATAMAMAMTIKRAWRLVRLQGPQMRTRAALTTAMATTVLGAALGAAPAVAAEQVKVVEHPVDETTVDLAAKGDSVGDMLVFANAVFDAANKTQVGTDQGYCVRTIVGKSWECIWTLTLKAGQITVEGPFFDEGDSLFAVTGGTGKYAGARGAMKLHARDPKATAYDFTYDLL